MLQVFRDPSYPEGVGSLDSYAFPLRGYVSTIEDHGDRLEIAADVEQVSRFQRSYEIERISLASAAMDADADHDRPECGYVIVAPNGKVAGAGSASFGGDGRLALSLKELRAPGVYTIMTAVYVGGNRMNPEVRVIEHRVAAAATTPAPRHSNPSLSGASR